MPTFDRDALRKGSKAIEDAVESRKNRDYTPFLSNIYWKSDKDFKYLLFLTPVEESLQVEYHPYIDVDNENGVGASIMARTDPSIGEKKDPIHDQWGYKPRLTNLAIAVELEPTITVVNNREKPTGFEVATRSFTRKIRDDDGNETGEEEEVTIPLVGMVAQSPHNFFKGLLAYDATENAVHSTPLKVTKLGKGSDVTYSIVGYEVPVDRGNLLDYIGEVSYVTDLEALEESLQGLDDEEASTAVGEYLLYKRIDELADVDKYNEILSQISKPAKFSDKKKKEDKPVRQARPSQRRAKATEESEPEEAAPASAVTKRSSPAEKMDELKRRARSKE